MNRRTASSLLSGFESSNFALLGDIENDTGQEPLLTAADAGLSVDELPADLRVGVALVAVSSESNSEDTLPLIARLRDVHADRVIAWVDNELTGARDALIAMGFEKRESPSEDGLLFVWDPALANRPREWNNSEHWANPENFSRYRW